MSALDLAKELGLSSEELLERVINRCAEQVLARAGYDEDGYKDEAPTAFANQLKDLVAKRVDAAIDDIATRHVLPNVTTYLEKLELQETNKWGEKRGSSVTFLEYLVQRAEHWMTEEVNYEGKGKKEADSYNWRGTQTRIAHMLHQHLHYTIENVIKEALKNAHSSIASGLSETVKLKLEEVSKQLKVEVKTR